MPRRSTSKPAKKPIEQYDHKGKTRKNNPPVGLVDAKSDASEGKRNYAYDPHLDPTLVWAGKAERTSFEIPTVSLHVHERIDPRSIIEAVRKKNGSDYEQLSLFSSKAENPPLREAIEFYRHAHNWSNRLVAGDSLLVMNSVRSEELLCSNPVCQNERSNANASIFGCGLSPLVWKGKRPHTLSPTISAKTSSRRP